MKKLILTSPFRHNLYLNDDFFFVNRGIFNQTISMLDELTPTLDISSAWLNNDKVIQDEKYISVKYDSLNLDSKPVLVIDFTNQVSDFLSSADYTDSLCFSVAGCYVKIYNNTIGLIGLTLSFDRLSEEIEHDPVQLDFLTTKLIEHVEENILRKEVERVLKYLRDCFKRTCTSRDVRKIYQDHVFDQVLEILKEERFKVLWTGRLLYVPDNEKQKWVDFFAKWSSTHVIPANNSAFFRQGNSLVLKSYIHEDEIISCFDLCQYYFAIFYLTNIVIKRVAGDFGKNRRALKKQLEICQEINLQVKNIEVNQKEALTGLQGKRRQAVKEILACWEYERYVDMVKSRNEILQAKINNHRIATNQRYGKIIEFVLALVGFIALADFLLNIVIYINPNFESLSRYSGILYVISTIHGEFIMSSIVLLAILFSVFFAIKKK